MSMIYVVMDAIGLEMEFTFATNRNRMKQLFSNNENTFGLRDLGFKIWRCLPISVFDIPDTFFSFFIFE